MTTPTKNNWSSSRTVLFLGTISQMAGEGGSFSVTALFSFFNVVVTSDVKPFFNMQHSKRLRVNGI